ncbi:TonB-dependent receptor plug domain-containing protein [Thalassomonas actiniarum]|uniref:TonB-dependent receptor n=1 Tax=Thalassomonas actiniarum TaxID=485447 RepID=A0AAE9YPG0_9GAMM|nr:TonB-dependent receptor [Thalassomonas actiniarum]WDD98610.1 TonB-dependent receptor [Thalassomonas actiniarum]
MNKNLITLAILAGSSLMSLQVLAFADNEQRVEQEVSRTAINQQPIVENKLEDDKVEKITITGSRLRRDSFSVATPLVTISREAIEDAGIGSLSTILVEEIPALSQSLSNTNTQSSITGTGISTVNLRNLGSDRTLTLIDGRRVVSNSYNGNYVSLSTIPAGMVEKVEVITGGASATYGSDAIAGVVNIITQQDKEGLEFKVRSGETPEGGGEELTLDLNYGTDFNEGRGYFYFSTTYDKQGEIAWNERDRAAIETDFDYDEDRMCNTNGTIDGDQCVRDISQDDWRARSDGLPGGVFVEGSGGIGGFWYNSDGLQSEWNEERDGVNYRQWDKLRTPEDTLSTAFKVNYDLTDDITSFFQIQYSNNQSVNVKAPEDEYEGSLVLVIDPVTGETSRVKSSKIPLTNPYIPEEILAATDSDIKWDRRMYEVGNVTTDNERETIRTWAGLQGTLFDGDWDWDVSVGYGNFQQEQKRLNEINVLNLKQALDAEYGEDGVTIQCADADARAAGCVPVNLFGEGSITEEAADWIRANPTISKEIEQLSFIGYIAGDLFALPAGPVPVVIGAEYRKDKQKIATSYDQQYGGITFNIVPAFSGEIDVKEVFVEAAFPLLADAPLAKSLTAETSLRLADYSHENIDLMSSYKLGLTWQPIEGYMLRANYARAQRAPNITEVLSPARGDYDDYVDICEGVTANSTGAGHDNCRKEASIAALISEDPNFALADENSGYSPNAGNDQLKEETGDTYTFGISMAPGFIENLQLAVDYYDITVDGAIEEIDNNEIINQCYNSSREWGESNEFCNQITRDSDGQIVEVMQRLYNVGELSTRGYDIALAYQYDLGDLGALKFKADMTHVIEYTKTYLGNDGEETLNYKGELESGIFDDSASASVTWSNDNWRISWSTKYKSAIVDSHERVEEHQAMFAANDENCAAGLDSCILDPETPNYLYYGSYIKHNFSASYTTQWQESEVRVFAGVNNVFDDKGPFVARGGAVGETGVGNFGSSYGGGVGRFLYLGSEVKF